MNLKRTAITCFGLLTFTSFLMAQSEFVPNYDENEVPEYTLPDPLDGISEASAWPTKRKEILTLIEREMFGRAPAFDGKTIAAAAGPEPFTILDGKATVTQVVLTIAGQDVALLVFLPSSATQPVPAFLGYNFHGNHTVFADDRISLTKSWVRKTENHRASEDDRGSSASRWSVERIIDAGYGLVTLYYGDVDPDFHDEFKNGVHAAFAPPKEDAWGSIAAWAWGLSRVLDYLEQESMGIDPQKVGVFGHSRLGKTSLWAGATDERFALVISNNSGCGGAALSKRAFGETVGRITRVFPHWFCARFNQYRENEVKLPFDQHMLLALMAPRPLYVASAVEDRWADPRGEFLSCVGADPVYRLLGTEGLPQQEMPGVNAPVMGRIGYHLRTGKHDVTDYDWEQYITFAKKHF